MVPTAIAHVGDDTTTSDLRSNSANSIEPFTNSVIEHAADPPDEEARRSAETPGTTSPTINPDLALRHVDSRPAMLAMDRTHAGTTERVNERGLQ